MIMNITATQITPERKQELVEQLVDLLSSRYDAGNLYDILRHGLGMDHSGRAVDYTIPKSWIKIVPPRIASEAQKASLARARKAANKPL